MRKTLFQSIFTGLTLMIGLLASSAGFSAVHLTIQGSASNNNLGLQTHSSRSASGSVAVDLGQYVRIGVTHREALIEQEGYAQGEDDDTYLFAKSTQYVTSNSLDLTLILYYGEIFVPYIMGGVVVKNYLVETNTETEGKVQSRYSGSPVPNGGFGVGIRLNKDFSLKISYTVSPGIRQIDPDSEPESVLDSYTSVGVSYNL